MYTVFRDACAGIKVEFAFVTDELLAAVVTGPRNGFRPLPENLDYRWLLLTKVLYQVSRFFWDGVSDFLPVERQTAADCLDRFNQIACVQNSASSIFEAEIRLPCSATPRTTCWVNKEVCFLFPSKGMGTGEQAALP
jgi:hypothetical protein